MCIRMYTYTCRERERCIDVCTLCQGSPAHRRPASLPPGQALLSLYYNVLYCTILYYKYTTVLIVILLVILSL